MRQPVHELSPPLASVLTRYERPPLQEAPARQTGRPKKRTEEYLLRLLNERQRLAAWYEAKHGSAPPSDRQLFTVFFADHFAANGERESRVTSPSFRAALKTLRNELAQARRLESNQRKS